MGGYLGGKKPLILVVAGIAIVAGRIYLKPNNSSSLQKQLELESKNGQIRLKSFQDINSEGTIQTTNFKNSGNSATIRNPASEPRHAKLDKLSRASRSRHKKEDLAQVYKINDQELVFQKNLFAIRAEGKNESNSPAGFEYVNGKSEVYLDRFNKSRLPVFTDKFGIDKRILTGAIVVDFDIAPFPQKLAQQFNLEISYLALQIKKAIFVVQEGQNIFEIEKKIRNTYGVKSVRLELVGKGVQAQ